ncbi:Uncharacterized protein APZ42_014271 [Daphnia magna]|uniref:Uncharacterized protein n=1 Tax=Daphnia magna TaxID=35525 RepID=A0A0P4Y3T4_9CRUS|nr:Uncharacterized protein APZ42_014271 [Daphnia magna]
MEKAYTDYIACALSTCFPFPFYFASVRVLFRCSAAFVLFVSFCYANHRGFFLFSFCILYPHTRTHTHK